MTHNDESVPCQKTSFEDELRSLLKSFVSVVPQREFLERAFTKIILKYGNEVRKSVTRWSTLEECLPPVDELILVDITEPGLVYDNGKPVRDYHIAYMNPLGEFWDEGYLIPREEIQGWQLIWYRDHQLTEERVQEKIEKAKES